MKREVAVWVSLEEVPLHVWHEDVFKSLVIAGVLLFLSMITLLAKKDLKTISFGGKQKQNSFFVGC